MTAASRDATWAVVMVLGLAGTTVSLQQTMVVPLLPGFQRLLDALGLPLGGVLFERFGWQSVFWLSAVVGAAILAAVLLVVSESDVKTRGRFDGSILLSIALTALLLPSPRAPPGAGAANRRSSCSS